MMSINNKKIKGIIFDVDGVLLDSVPYHFAAWKMLFTDIGINFSYRDYIEKVNGLPRLTGIGNIVGHDDRKRLGMLAERKQTYLLAAIQQDPPKPLAGVLALLTQLKQCKVKLAAASSSKNAPVLLKKAHLDTFFDIIINGNDFSHPKPNPEIFLLASRKLGLLPQECVVIEDALLGIQAAKNGGMHTIGLLSSHDKEIKKQADMAIESMEKYKHIIRYVTTM